MEHQQLLDTRRGLTRLYRFYINNVDNDYHYGELARIFLNEDEFEVIAVDYPEASDIKLRPGSYMINKSCSVDRDAIKREFFYLLNDISGIKPDWGTLTGVRPLKLALDLLHRDNSLATMQELLRRDYLLNQEKIDMLSDIAQYQSENVTTNPSDKVAIYVGIPFCPTRCAYCSFASNVAGADAIEKYVNNLLKEIEYMGSLYTEHNSVVESIYIGGGTPTTLSAEQLRRIIIKLKDCFGVDIKNIEFTIEAGRPDTITEEKLSAMRDLGISRISINPQTMKNDTLRLIGRNHSSEDIVRAYDLANKYDFDVINADLIAGLPEESLEDFISSLEQVIALGANNITVHTLSVKRGSRLKENDPDYYRHNAEMVAEMLRYARNRLKDEGFYPYYIYRQKHQIGALENVGYCKNGKHSLYNIRIMEEKQTIIGLGCGAIGKVYYPSEDRLERIPNVSNYEVYNERFEEMLDRKNRYYE